MSWPFVELSEICQTTQGVQITKEDTSSTPYKGGNRYLYIADFVKDNKLSFVDDVFPHKLVTENDLVMANTGSPGRVFKGKSGILSNNLFKISFAENVDRDFLYFILSSDEFQDVLQKQMKGGIQKHLGHKTISIQKIPLPPLPVQKQIAAVLEKADTLRQQCKQMEQELNVLAQSVFLDMFGDPVTNPQGWEVKKLKELVSIQSGATPSKSNDSYWLGNFPWVSPKDMKTTYISNSIDHISEKVFEETNLKRILPNTILIVVRGMILVHTVPLAITNGPVSINQDIKALKVTDKSIESIYLLWCLKCQHDNILSKVSTAAHGTKRLDSPDLVNLNICIPEIGLQEKFVKSTELLNEQIHYSKTLVQYYESLFLSLMQRALKGELDLKDVA